MSDIEEIIDQAIKNEASDIHIDPHDDFIYIRHRIDGVIYEIKKLNLSKHSEIIAKIKILSGMRVDEHFKPQDGRWAFGKVDIRVSIMPTVNGENAVLRLLKKRNTNLSLSSLGMQEKEQDLLTKILSKERGMIIVSGPTGSGKTTTLYTLLSKYINQNKIVVTIEDPVEYTLKGVRQVGIRHGQMNFANGLKAILRQDPDVIMIGEIRDPETAAVAVNAALTGHIVISTIHTDSAKAVENRLIDMGIAKFQIEAISLVCIAQRLLRLLCESCRGNGCKACEERGYKGRSAIYEIKSDENNTEYKKLYESAIELVRQNKTSLSEVERVLGNNSFL